MAAFLDGYARPGPTASLLCDHSSGFRKVPGERHTEIVLNMQERARAMPISDETFVDATMQNPANVVIIERLRCLGLPQCFLTAGCLFQTVWSLRSSRPAQADIKDYDIFYFDNSDLSWDAEDAVIQQAKALLGDLQVSIEVKNQARVHLWYEKRFWWQLSAAAVLEGWHRSFPHFRYLRGNRCQYRRALRAERSAGGVERRLGNQS